MSALLDTSVIVRYLTGDPPAMAARAARLIDSDTPLVITDLILAETCYVLTSVYGIPLDRVVDRVIDLIGRRNIATFPSAKPWLTEGLALCRPSGRVSVVDAMLRAAAHASEIPTVYSFDERFPAEGLDVRQPD